MLVATRGRIAPEATIETEDELLLDRESGAHVAAHDRIIFGTRPGPAFAFGGLGVGVTWGIQALGRHCQHE